MSEYNLGIVGAGDVVSFNHLPILSRMDSISIDFIADVDGQKARALCNDYSGTPVVIDDPEELPRCDLLLLATPVTVREPYIREYGDRGTPILSEKPFATSVEDHESYLEMSSVIDCNYMRVNFSNTRQIHALVKGGPFGALERVEISREMVGSTGMGTDDYRLDADTAGGGILMENGCHALSQLTYALDSYSVTVSDADLYVKDGSELSVNASLLATTDDNEVPVTFALSSVEPIETISRFVFETAVVEFDHTEADSLVRVKLQEPSDHPVSHPTFTADDRWAVTPKQAFYIEWERFMSLADYANPPDTATMTGLTVTRLIEEIYNHV